MKDRKLRQIIGISWILALLTLLIALIATGKTSSLGVSMSPLFTLLGRVPKTADRVVGRSLTLDDADEAMLAERFQSYIKSWEIPDHHCALPIEQILQVLTPSAVRGLQVKSFIIAGEPNAMAFPGGSIAITNGLLTALPREAQRAAVLAHELGHLELRHSFDAVKFEMLARKVGMSQLGAGFDGLARFFVSHSFSKTQEDEADQYAFQLLQRHGYPPEAMAEALDHLLTATQKKPPHTSFLRDYFSSHPPLPQRIENFRDKAAQVRAEHPGPFPRQDSHISEGCDAI